MKKCLYKLDASLRLREWCAWVESFTHHSSLFIRYGISGGSPVFQRYDYHESTNSPSYYLLNQPRANSHVHAAELDLKSRYEFQVNRKGYTEKIPHTKPYRPMLAKVYQNNLDHVPPMVYIQPKLNGIRCLASSLWLISRTNERFSAIPHIEEALSKLPEDVVLDGELYMPGSSLQEIMGAVRRHEPSDLSKHIQYHVFDIVDESLSFTDRHNYVKELFSSFFFSDSPIKMVDTIYIPSKEIDEHYQFFLRHKYEGAIVRNPNGPYEINVRSLNLLKYKPRQTAHFRIWCIKPMKNDKSQAILQLEGLSGHFDCSVKGTKEYRYYLLKNASSYKGRIAEIEFEDYSDDNKPIQPICTRII